MLYPLYLVVFYREKSDIIRHFLLLTNCLQNALEHKADKVCAISLCVRLGNGFVVFLLMFFNDCFHRKPCKNTFPSAQQYCLPVASHATITSALPKN